MAIVTPHNCTSGKVIGFVVVIVLVVVVDTNFGKSQHQCTCTTCRRHIEVATGGKLAPTPSNQFNTTGICSICRLSDLFCWATMFCQECKMTGPKQQTAIYVCIYAQQIRHRQLYYYTSWYCSTLYMVIDCSVQHTKQKLTTYTTVAIATQISQLHIQLSQITAFYRYLHCTNYVYSMNPVSMCFIASIAIHYIRLCFHSYLLVLYTFASIMLDSAGYVLYEYSSCQNLLKWL